MKFFKSLLLLIYLCTTPFALVAGSDNNLVRLATTTSTENSGLLKALLPSFEKETGYKVHVIAVGTGKALRMGRDGDVDGGYHLGGANARPQG